MDIDGRNSDDKEIILRLREIFRTQGGGQLYVNVAVSNKGLVKKIRAFAKMSGYDTECHDRDGYLEVRIFGSSCRCG
ncbi:MAG: hypothetical protein P8Y77_08995 [Nitrospirota bacterium]|jgi:hypothetical protein